MKTYSQLNTEEIRMAFKKYVSNNKKCDVYSIWYKIGMIKITYSPTPPYKRNELLDILFDLIKDDKNLYKVIKSEYTEKMIELYANK